MSTISEAIINSLKRVPLDLGQGNLRTTTKGKLIALSLVRDGHGKKALDVGAREGAQTRWLQARGYEVTSIDVESLFPECLQVDANKPLPFEDARFDLIWSSEVIEHLEDPAAALSELRRVTKPGGELILTTPNSYAFLFRLLSLVGLTPQRIQRKDHLHFFDADDIKRLAPDAELYGYFPYMLVRRCIRRGIGQLSPTFVMHIHKR
ncbi:MAG TPA: class I SAM-dependent methyltransferase [Polyangiaceae bacterium]|nr:class I SAM-dependent methyltransferase [Polyangiaceae bacterium]HMR77048.1 class I SAM-dependent methyltransferase [Polyangiaceae bacterium]